MQTNAPIIVERVDNGWLIRTLHRPDELISFSDMLVFQELQYDGAGVQHSEKCLFGFLLKHFPEKPSA